MFSSKYVKIAKTDWENIKRDYNDLLAEVAVLKAENKELRDESSEFLMTVVKKQSEEIKKLMKYKAQDDALFSYEQSNDKHLKTIRKQEERIKELENENETLLHAFQREASTSSLLAKKIAEANFGCEKYKTVSQLDIHA